MAARRNILRRGWAPLNSGSSGASVSYTPGAATVAIPWNVQVQPRNGAFHRYLEGFWVRQTLTIDQPGAGGAVLYDDRLSKVIHSYELTGGGKLGTVWDPSVTSGARVRLIDSRIACGYFPATRSKNQIAAADGDTVIELLHWLPFSMGIFDKPHHFAPHCQLVNDAILRINANINTIIAEDSTGGVYKSPTMSVIAQYVEDKEIRLHTPIKWGLYEPQGAGSSIRLPISGLGAKRGMNGVLDRQGLLAAYLMTSAGGLGGTITGAQISRVQADFLGIPSLEFPEMLVVDHLQQIPYTGPIGSQAAETHNDEARWPYLQGSTAGNHLRAGLLYYPLVMPPQQAELSKVSETPEGGGGEAVIGFTSTLSQTTFKLGTCEVGTWDPAFMTEAKRIILGSEADRYAWVPKLLRKQEPDEDGEYPMDGDKMRYFPWRAVRPGQE